MNRPWIPTCLIVAASTVLALSCGANRASTGDESSGNGQGGTNSTNGKKGCTPSSEICGDHVDNDCDGQIDEGFDQDNDSVTSCAGDCNDNDAAVNPAAVEVLNGADDNCDSKIDNQIAGNDYDKDGSPFPQDCNDDEALVGPNAVEVAGDNTDNNCDGKVDETVVCDDGTGVTALDFAKAIGMCSNVTSADFVTGQPDARRIWAKFGDQWTPKEGSKMAMFSSGKAQDGTEAYQPQGGYDFGTTAASHPLYTKPRCGAPPTAPKPKDMSELKIRLTVPQNAKSLSYQFNFFSAEYPEYVCTMFNDRFIALLESAALDSTQPVLKDQCIQGAVPTCNISFDDKSQPVTINNGFFDVCESASGSGWSNTCTKPVSMLNKTGYELPTLTGVAGGATGWLTTKAPVKPGETITLRFIIFDEGDGVLDSAVLIDNFKWDTVAVNTPVTDPGLN